MKHLLPSFRCYRCACFELFFCTWRWSFWLLYIPWGRDRWWHDWSRARAQPCVFKLIVGCYWFWSRSEWLGRKANQTMLRLILHLAYLAFHVCFWVRCTWNYWYRSSCKSDPWDGIGRKLYHSQSNTLGSLDYKAYRNDWNRTRRSNPYAPPSNHQLL